MSSVVRAVVVAVLTTPSEEPANTAEAVVVVVVTPSALEVSKACSASLSCLLMRIRAPWQLSSFGGSLLRTARTLL